MAIVETARGPQPLPTNQVIQDPNVELPIWVNVAVPVGENLRNQPSIDTRWVQFVIKSIFDAPGMSRLTRPLKVDGIFGDTTKAWIKHFQQDPKAQSLAQGPVAFIPVRPDGLVSRVPVGAFTMRRGFTAYRLNKALAVTDRLRWIALSNAARTNPTLEAFIKANA